MKKVIVIGKNSFIATHLPYEKSDYRFSPDEKDISNFIDANKPDVLINCIGMTGKKNIDDIELEKARAANSNTVLPIMLASKCEQKGINFIHISSGCINYGPSPNNKEIIDIRKNPSTSHFEDTGWREDEFAQRKNNPMSSYSKTKLAADLVIGSLSNVSSLRIRMPISSMFHPRNLLNKLIGFKKVLEEPNSMTFLRDLTNAVQWIIDNNKTGIYNIASPKPLTHSMLLDEYKRHVPAHTYEKISKEELNKLVSAPRSNCILDVSKSINEGFRYYDTDYMIKETVRQFVINKI